MSRCFPYPPPGYSRNGATYEALIESIKLQKENDKAKAERKKEKRARKEKKEKEKRKDGEKKGKLQKISNECQPSAQKLLQSTVDSKEGHNKGREPSTELLERSDLTEERGQPISSQNPSYSSDGTTNSNKRKRDDASLPDGTSGHGKPIKIRLLKKNQEPVTTQETLCSNSGRADARLNTCMVSPCEPLALSNRSAGIPATSGRENNAGQDIVFSQTKSIPSSERHGTKSLQELHFGRKQSVPSSGRLIVSSSSLKHELPSSNSNQTKLPVPTRPRKSGAEVHHSSVQWPTASHARFVVPQIHLEHETPRPTLNVASAPSTSGILDLPPSHLKHGLSSLDSNKAKTAGKKMKDSIPVPGSGDGRKEVLTRSEKKILKKHLKYEKLIGSWVPPVLDAQLPVGDDGDEDWLTRSSRKVRSSSSREEVETCRETSLWQPCSRYLAEADIHALPYTVPF